MKSTRIRTSRRRRRDTTRATWPWCAADGEAVVVLGTATPSLESYFNAKRGKYELLELTTRVDDQKMPVVRVVDMRSETRKQKGLPIFSHNSRKR
jgi:primosomal protein N'